jgi:ring-1,2-phenylacetyl-CoA epoxidase subunit PaaC
MGFDNAYESLVEEHGDETRWAYGTGFTDGMAGVDRALPSGVEPAELAAYCLMLGDDALVLAQRLAEWCSRAPELEEDVALANIALDLLGQARLLLTRAGEVDLVPTNDPSERLVWPKPPPAGDGTNGSVGGGAPTHAEHGAGTNGEEGGDGQ